MGQLVTFDSMSEFLTDCETYLLEREVQNNLILGIAYSLREQRLPEGMELLAVKYQDRVTAVCISSRNRPILSSTTYEERDIMLLSSYFREKSITGMIGETLYADIFARSFEAPCHVTRRLMVHQLLASPSLKDAGKRFGAAAGADVPKLTQLLQAYEKETGHTNYISQPEAAAVIEKQVAAKELFIWRESGEIVCMAAILRYTKNYAIVGNVYTPPFSRNQGYAHCCVRELSRLIFERGFRGCVLYTDQSNPVSAKVYSDIGYSPVGEFCEVSFLETPQF